MTCIPLLALLNISYHLLTCTVVFFSISYSLYLPFSFTRLSPFSSTPLTSIPLIPILSLHFSFSLNHSCFFISFMCLYLASFFVFFLMYPFPIPSLFSFITWKDREWRHREEDLEDHRFWPGQGVAQNHKNVSCRHLLLDGSWGHQVISLLQRQWRLGVWQIIHTDPRIQYLLLLICLKSFLC